MKIKAKKIHIFLKKFPWIIGGHFFPSFLFAALLAFIIGGAIFYRYVFLTENVEFNILERPVFFQEDIYKEILEELNNRKKIIQELDSKEYSNPFAPIYGETGTSTP